MMGRMALMVRGFLIVLLTAANIYQIAHKHYAGMFVVGMAISIVWWANAKTSSVTTVPGARYWYGVGAGCGTVAGTALMAWWYGS